MREVVLNLNLYGIGKKQKPKIYVLQQKRLFDEIWIKYRPWSPLWFGKTSIF